MSRKKLEKQFDDKHVTWMIDMSLLEGTFSEKLPKVVLDMGYKTIVFSGNPNTYDLLDMPVGFMDEGSGPMVAYGTHAFILNCMRYPWVPGAYPSDSEESWHLSPITYMTKFPKEVLFNENYVITQMSELLRNKSFFFKIFHKDLLFVKDCEAFKLFGAKVLNRQTLEQYLTPYVGTSNNMQDNQLVMLSDVKPISSEHRFVIVDKEVVAHSTYKMGETMDIRIDVPEKALDFAKEMAQIWNPCSCYTLDVAMVGSGPFNTQTPKLLELNSFSCAGLYACDLERVVEAVSRQTREDYLTLVADMN